MKRLHLFGLLAVFFALAFFAAPVFAAGPPVVINEVLFNSVGSESAGEWVELAVVAAPGDMNGWAVRDKGGTTFTFPAISPTAGEYIVLHTGSGTDDLTPPVYHLYWGRGSGIWNNTGDEILLTDGTADVDYIAYGSVSPTISGTLTWAGTNPTAPEGSSISLKNNGVDTDTGDDWEASGTSVTRAPSSAGETNAAPVAVWVDNDFCPACANGGHTWGYDAFSAIQPGLSALAVDGTAWIADGIYTETLRVTKNVSLIGASETGVTVDASAAASGYGIEATGDISTTWRNFTLIGPPAAATGYGIKIAGENAQTVLENITVKNSGRSGVDLNGLAAASLTNITALNNGGVGIGLTDSSNVLLAGITTTGNAWGGIGIYTYGRYYSGGSDGIALTGANNFGEQNPLYVETENYSDPANPYPVTNFSQSDFGFTVRNTLLPADTFYQPTQTDAITTALTLPAPGAEQPHQSTITELTTGNWLVADGMSIQTAVDSATTGDTVRVLNGTFVEQVMMDKSVSLLGNGVGNTIIQSPPTLSPCFSGVSSLLCISDATDVRLENLTVGGAESVSGIGFQSGGGIVQNTSIFGNSDGVVISATTALTISNNLIYSNTNNGITILDDLSATGFAATGNQFCDNGGRGIENQFITATATATENWWGAVDGPGTIAAGHGDRVSAGVDTSNFTTVPPASGPCQTADITVRAVTDPATGATGFPFGGDLGSFSLDDGGTFTAQLPPGTVAVTETVPSGWQLTGVTCTANSTPLTDGVSVPLNRGDDVTCTFTNDPLPNILASKILSVETLPEPGGTLTATVTITNTTAETVTLSTLADSAVGDVNGRGTCATGGNLAPFGVYSCSFADSVSGNAGDVFSDTLSATVQDEEGNTASAADSASMTLTDVLPTISVTKSVTPTVLPVGGGVVTVTVTVQNTGVEPVYLVSLYDDNLYRALDGNLSGIGSCAVGMWIATANNYGCTFTQTVGGAAGDVRNDKITASAIDDENNIVTADSIAGLIINTPPAFTSTPLLTATIGAAYTYTVTVSDANAGDPLTITAPTLPAWLSFADNGDGTATLFGTPATDDAGESPVVLAVSDGMATVTQPFSIIVSEPPSASSNIRIYLPLVVR